jgi:hypothetical protein
MFQVNMGGEVPRSYYLNCRPDTNYKKYLSISQGSKEQLEFQVKEANSVLKYLNVLSE